MDFYNKFINDVETIVNRFEEGISVIMNGENPDGQSTKSSKQDLSKYDDEAFSDENIGSLDEDELQLLLQEHGDFFETSPLEGIADSVVSDIIKNKVTCCILNSKAKRICKSHACIHSQFPRLWVHQRHLNTLKHFEAQ